MTTIVGVSGSLRAGSYNSALLRAAGAMISGGIDFEIASIAGIPLYDGDVEAAEGVPEPVQALKAKLAVADGLLIATPEYDAGIPGVAKNAFDWASRPPADTPEVFGDLPVALIGVGGRGGTRFAQGSWLPLFRYLGMRPWHGASLFGAGAWGLFEDGVLTDEKTRELLARVLDGFCAHILALPRRRA